MSTSALPNTYVVGQIVFLEDLIDTGEPDHTPVDDATDAVTVYLPDGTTARPDVTHDGIAGSGRYVAQFTPTQAGWHTYVWISTGAGAGADPVDFWVRPVP